MKSPWLSLGIFIVCYVLFVAWPRRRALTAMLGAAALVAVGAVGWHAALTEMVSWNVIGLFFGTLILAELFMQSRMPAVLAEWLVARCRTALGAMLLVCALSAVLSMFLENVAVVLLVAPVALSLTDKLKISPVQLLIGIAVASNLQGTATLIGDPPSMILAGHMKLSFNDFFSYQGRPGIFWAVQVGGVAAFVTLAWILRRHHEPATLIAVETPRAWTPTVLLILLVAGLSCSSFVDPGFRWLAGTYTLALAAAGLLWYRFGPHWTSVRTLIKTLDWDTTFFLIGVFVVVGGLSESGWLDRLAGWISASCGSSKLAAFALLVAVSVVVSGFVDNVPYLLAMIPVAQKVAEGLNTPVPLLMFGLLIGACLGGNITPIGASANVVAMGLLRKQGHHVTFRTFMGVGIPFTIAAVLAAAAFIWTIWAK